MKPPHAFCECLRTLYLVSADYVEEGVPFAAIWYQEDGRCFEFLNERNSPALVALQLRSLACDKAITTTLP